MSIIDPNSVYTTIKMAAHFAAPFFGALMSLEPPVSMNDPQEYLSHYGARSIEILRQGIEEALVKGNEVEALRLDELLIKIENTTLFKH